MPEEWGERIDRELAEGKAVARGERRKAREEDQATPELCLSWHPDGGPACLQPKGHAGAHRSGPTRWHE